MYLDRLSCLLYIITYLSWRLSLRQLLTFVILLFFNLLLFFYFNSAYKVLKIINWKKWLKNEWLIFTLMFDVPYPGMPWLNGDIYTISTFLTHVELANVFSCKIVKYEIRNLMIYTQFYSKSNLKNWKIKNSF